MSPQSSSGRAPCSHWYFLGGRPPGAQVVSSGQRVHGNSSRKEDKDKGRHKSRKGARGRAAGFSHMGRRLGAEAVSRCIPASPRPGVSAVGLSFHNILSPVREFLMQTLLPLNSRRAYEVFQHPLPSSCRHENTSHCLLLF